MADAGWVKIHRRVIDWNGWKDDAVFKLFAYCVIRANRKRALVNGTWIECGQFAFSGRDAAEDLGWSYLKLRRAMQRLEQTETVVFNRTVRGTIAKVTAYGMYQCIQNEHADEHADRHTDEHTDDTLTRSINTEKNNQYNSRFYELWRAYPDKRRGNKKAAAEAYDLRLSEGVQHEAIMARLEADRLTQGFTAKDGQFIPSLCNWLDGCDFALREDEECREY